MGSMPLQGHARGRRRRASLYLAVALLASASGTARADIEVAGRVFADRDGDGALSPGDTPLAGVRVAWETRFLAETDAQGRYRMRAPGPGIVWAHIPAGYQPHPVWVRVDAGTAGAVDLGLRPSAAAGPLLFVHASDSHLGNVGAAATREALARATALAPGPHFLTITGDLTSHTAPGEFAALAEALAGMDVPFVPVPGNHDWHDRGPGYRARYGPPMYSFDARGVRFVVLNFNTPEAHQLAFATAALADLDARARSHGPPIAVLTHAPPSDHLAAELAALGVDYAFTGHIHSNQVIDHGGMVELNTEPLVMGGIDYTPAGYRVVTRAGDALVAAHHTLVRAPHLRIVHPRPAADGCVAAGVVEVIAAVELGQPPDAVTIELDGAMAVPAAPAGGWTWTARFEVGAPGPHRARVRAVSATGREHAQEVVFCVEEAAPAVAVVSDWPQLQGGSTRRGARDATMPPPLIVAWARTTGGHLRGGSAVVAGGRVHVPVVDLGAGTAGGIVTFDARTGATLWAHRTGVSVHNAPAVWNGQVVFTTADGYLHVLDAATGAPRWRHDLGAGRDAGATWLYAAPAVAGGVAYVGLHERMAAVDLRARTVRWQARRDTLPLVTLASSSTGGGVVVSVFGRNTVIAWDARTGRERWRYRNDVNRPIHAAPVIDGARVYLVDSSTRAVALDLASGAVLWKQPLMNGVPLGGEVVGTPALGVGKLLVPTPRHGLIALDAGTGRILWRLAGQESAIHPFSYLTRARGMAAAPAVTGDIVWAGGSDGVLRAVDVRDGRALWSMDVGAPILGGPVPAGELLIVTSYDGTVRALRVEPSTIVGCNARSAVWLALLSLLALAMLARPRPAGGAHRTAPRAATS